MADVKLTFTTPNYSRYTSALRRQVPDIRIEMLRCCRAEARRKAMEHKLRIPDYFNDGDRVIYIDGDVIVNRCLDDLFGMVSPGAPFCLNAASCFNSGLYAVMITQQTRQVYRRATEIFSEQAGVKKNAADEVPIIMAIRELGVKVHECRQLQSHQERVNPGCYVNHYWGRHKFCRVYQAFLKSMGA